MHENKLFGFQLMSFLRDVFAVEAEKQHVKMKTMTEYDAPSFDFFFPRGLSILDTNRETYVEVKVSKNLKMLNSQMKHLIKQNPDAIYIIIHTSQNGREQYGSEYVRYYGIDYLNYLCERYKGIYDLYFGNYSSELTNDKRFDEFNHELLEKRKETSRELNEINTSLFRDKFLNGSAAIVLGNGVSIPFGADGWKTLVENLLDYLVPHGLKSPESIQKVLSDSMYAESSFAEWAFSDKEKTPLYNKALQYCIYRKYDESLHANPSLLNIVATAKKERPRMPILTYNYDLFLESQYKFDFGMKMNHYSGKDYIHYFKDCIIHLHGYLSDASGATPKGLILTDRQYFSAYLNSKSTSYWVYQAQRDALNDYSVLYIGSSMSDVFQLSVIDDVYQEKSKKKQLWNCYALMCFKDVDDNDIYSIIQYYNQKGIKIIFEKDFDELINRLKRILL